MPSRRASAPPYCLPVFGRSGPPAPSRCRAGPTPCSRAPQAVDRRLGKPGSIEIALRRAGDRHARRVDRILQVILWSIRFSVTLSTELMIVAPPGEP